MEAWGTRLELKGGQFTRRRKRVPRSCRRKLQLDEQAGIVLLSTFQHVAFCVSGRQSVCGWRVKQGPDKCVTA